MVEKFVERREVESQPAIERIVHQQNQVEQQQLQAQHFELQLDLARREAMIEETRLEAELSRKQNQVDHGKQQYDTGLINEQDLQQLENEVTLAKLHFEQNQLKAKRHLRDLEMQLNHQQLLLKQLERTQDQQF